ncbi:MAG: hypothetical protein P4M12_04460 [Gammaproteobacteria bacterium]|nr:hypothetical protein [Gammaproteobacteria bacterium]
MPNKKKFPEQEEDESGRGGKSGEIEFRYKDAFTGPTRDDLLPPNEIKRLMIVHKDTHKMRVDKQKQLREERVALKEGKYIPNNERVYQKGFGASSGGSSSRYKKHPISDKAYFSGKDKQVVGVPTLTESNTNEDLKEALENKLENKYQNVPKFNPKPRYPGS